MSEYFVEETDEWFVRLKELHRVTQERKDRKFREYRDWLYRETLREMVAEIEAERRDVTKV